MTTAKKKIIKPKPQMLTGRPLNPNLVAASRYYERLNKLIDTMTATVEKRLKRLFESETGAEYFAEDASIASQARILTNALMARFDDMFGLMAKPLAEQMVREANNSSSAALYDSLKELSGGFSLSVKDISPEMKQILNATITENVGLIKSISSEYLDGVQGAVMRSITTSGGLKDLVPYLKNHKGITKRRARLIASDQTRKAFSNLSRARLQNAGLKQFEWRHTSGSKEPRQLHIEYNGRIFDFDNLPVIDKKTGERGIPGQAINCRCRIVPVIKFED